MGKRQSCNNKKGSGANRGTRQKSFSFVNGTTSFLDRCVPDKDGSKEENESGLYLARGTIFILMLLVDVALLW